MKQRSSSEHGYLLVFFAITIGLLLSFCALVIDAGQGYLWKMRADKAARAAVLSGLGYRGFKGWTYCSGDGREDLLAVTRQVAIDNLNTYNPPTPPTVTASYDPITDAMQVDITLQPTAMFAGRAAGLIGFSIPALGQVRGFARAQLNAARVALLLDVSGSMACPRNDDVCSCRFRGNCPAGAQRVDDLVTGVRRFQSQFNPNRDVIGVIAFNLAADVRFPMTSGSAVGGAPFGAPAARLTAFNAALNNLPSLVKSNTNICDALIEAIGQLRAIVPPGSDARLLAPSVVLFSDGAPNAFRGIFSNSYTRPSPLPANTDAYHYSLEWYDDPLTYRGPGPIIERTTTGGVPQLFGFNITQGAVAPTGARKWGITTSDPRNFRSVLDGNTAPPVGQERGALTTLNFTLPNTHPNRNNLGPISITGVPFSGLTTGSEPGVSFEDPNWANISPKVTAPISYQNFDQLPYYCAITAADFIRSEFGGTVYTIGLGPGSPRCGDPLQDADDHIGRKDYFLERLANSENARSGGNWRSTHAFSTGRRSVSISGIECTATGTRRAHRFARAGTPPVNADTPPVNVGYTTNLPSTSPSQLNPPHPDFPDRTDKNIDTTGEYLSASNSGELSVLFGTIAKQILLRLTPSGASGSNG